MELQAAGSKKSTRNGRAVERLGLEAFKGLDEPIDVRVGMGGGNEGDFKATGRSIEACIEHVMEIGRVGLLVTGFGIIEVADGGFTEKGSEHAPALGTVQVEILCFGDLVHASR